MADGRTNLNPETKNAPKAKKDFTYLFQKDQEPVRGIFRFFEVPGGTMGFSYRKWKQEEVTNYSLEDGCIYTIPRGVAHHLVNNCWYPESAFKMNEQGIHNVIISKKKKRCNFESLDFMDPEMMADLTPSNLETVTFLK
jgi:hypothetical protein